MATARTKADALGWYQSDPKGLGGTTADTEAQAYAVLVASPIPAVIVQAATAQQQGQGTIRATGVNALAYTAPGDTEGAAVTVAANTSVLLESDTVGMAVRVYRDSVYDPSDLGGTMTVDLLPQFNTPLAGPNADENGGDYYAVAAWIKNHSDLAITDIEVTPRELGSPAVSDDGQLGGTGSGTITTTGDFADWPTAGWCHIREDGGATRELIYYSSRSDTALTVPAAGRALLGTSAAAGANDDVLTPVAPIRLWLESPTAGAVQTIANNATEPTSPTWTFEATVASLDPGESMALWIHRDIPAGATVDIEAASGIAFAFDSDSATYGGEIIAMFRIGDTDLDQYELYNGADAQPDFNAAPLAVSATLPFSEALTDDASNYYAVRRRNRYGLASFNIVAERRDIDGDSEDVTALISAPVVLQAQSIAGGEIALVLQYNGSLDTIQADTWRLYISDDGGDPLAEDPVDYSMAPQALAGPAIIGRLRIGPYAFNTEVSVVARAYSSADDEESSNTTPTDITVTTQEPVAPNWPGVTTGGYWGHATTGYDSTTAFGDASIRIVAGETILYASAEAFRGVLGNGAALRTGLEFANVTHNSAGSSGPIEAVDSDTIYINVNGTRRALIDLDSGTIEADEFEFMATAIGLPAIGPVHAEAIATYIQIFNGLTGRWTPLIKVDSDGLLTATVPILQEIA